MARPAAALHQNNEFSTHAIMNTTPLKCSLVLPLPLPKSAAQLLSTAAQRESERERVCVCACCRVKARSKTLRQRHVAKGAASNSLEYSRENKGTGQRARKAKRSWRAQPTNSIKSFYTNDCYFRFMKPRRVYQVLVKVAFTEAPDCWDQLPPTLKEFWPRLEEAESEEKESISNWGLYS